MKVVLAVLCFLTPPVMADGYQDYLCNLQLAESVRYRAYLQGIVSCTDIARASVAKISDAWESAYTGRDIEWACEDCREDLTWCEKELRKLEKKFEKSCGPRPKKPSEN